MVMRERKEKSLEDWGMGKDNLRRKEMSMPSVMAVLLLPKANLLPFQIPYRSSPRWIMNPDVNPEQW